MFNAFIDFGDIKGESTDDKFKDQVGVLRYEHEITQPPSVTQKTAGGRSAEEVQHGAFKIWKLLDAATPKLYEAACKGAHIPTVKVSLVRSGGDPLVYMQFDLKEVLISRIVQDGNPYGDAKFPTEIVELTYGAIEWTYTKQKADGSAGGNVAAKWSLAKGAAV
jgi:type VI secretion system secreted protein Hcp